MLGRGFWGGAFCSLILFFLGGGGFVCLFGGGLIVLCCGDGGGGGEKVGSLVIYCAFEDLLPSLPPSPGTE